MLTVFNLKRGDRRPYLYATLGSINEEGELNTPQPLTGATVVFNMKNEAGVLVVNRGPCVVDNIPAGAVHYEWGATDTLIAGTYTGEFEASFGAEAVTFPNGSEIKIKIREDLG